MTSPQTLNIQVEAPIVLQATQNGIAVGADGLSAYQIWLDEGNTGTEQDFLDSLKGEGLDDHESTYDHTLIATALQSETDPVFTNSQAYNITETDITNLGNLSGTNTGDQDLSGKEDVGVAAGLIETHESTYDHQLLGKVAVTLNEYMYIAASKTADTANDWRMYADANGFYFQFCTVGNATKGGGTWLTKFTIQI